VAAREAFNLGWTSPKLEDIQLAAGRESADPPMEARIARIEADVAHLRTDLADFKVEVRTRLDRIDLRMDRLEAKFDAFKDATRGEFVALREKIASTEIRTLVLHLTLTAGMLGVMARGFGWI
jgi:hypothetical protein